MDNLFLKSRLNYLIIAIIIPIIFTYSCKKGEGNQLNDFNNAKSWYQNTGDKVATVLKSDQGIEIEIKKDVAWNKAKTIMLDGGTELTTVPIKLKSVSGANINGNFNLLITKKANQYKSRIVYIDNNANLGESITDDKAIELYKKAFTNINSALLKSKSLNSGSLTINNKLMNAPKDGNIDGGTGTTTCTDWYLVDTTYDSETGEIFDQDIQYLYTKCTTNSDGGSNGGTSETAPSDQAIKDAIENNPFAFLADVDCELVKKWLSSAKFTPDGTIFNKLNSLTHYMPIYSSHYNHQQMLASVQKIDNAYSTVVNMDYFSVRVNTLPIVNGQKLTAPQFLHYIRVNLNNFTDGSKTFSPYNAYGIDDRAQWNSSTPKGSIIAINIPGPDNGSVITSYSSNDKWTFTTIYEPMYKTHPVSGNRDFGYTENTDGTYTFYTRGVDRLTTWDVNFLQKETGIPFEQADKLWHSFQNGVKSFTDAHQGKASIVDAEKHRPNWDLVKDVIAGKKPLNSISKKCPPQVKYEE